MLLFLIVVAIGFVSGAPQFRQPNRFQQQQRPQFQQQRGRSQQQQRQQQQPFRAVANLLNGNVGGGNGGGGNRRYPEWLDTSDGKYAKFDGPVRGIPRDHGGGRFGKLIPMFVVCQLFNCSMLQALLIVSFAKHAVDAPLAELNTD